MEPVYFLLVDDRPENLLSLEALLQREGLTLLKAQSGEQALELLLDHEVALALLDVQMPGMDGFELAEIMRGSERTRHVPIIFLTASSGGGQRRFQGYEAGAVDFIQKPIEPDVLRSKASVFFELHRQRQQLAAQRDALEAYAETLRTSDRYKDHFLAVLAHELRNPLTPLRVGLDILRRQPSPERAEQLHNAMDRQLVQLVRLVDDLLDVSRISQGKILLKKERLLLSDVVQLAVEGSRPLIDAAGHALLLELPATPSALHGDQARLAQAIGNLLNNAAKYTPGGGQITLSLRHEEHAAIIEVRDNGMGIPADALPKVFDMFMQVGDHLTRSQGGLGIGLALVRQFVLMHGGEIGVHSDGEGLGSCFSIRLPLDETLAMTDEPAPSIAINDAARLRVLVVDDNDDVATTVGWLLNEMGHECRVVRSGVLALAAAQEFQPNAVLLDIGMAQMNGYDVCRALRQDPGLQHIQVIAQTGWGQDYDKAQTSKAGFDAHLVKPIGQDDLRRVLASALESPRAATAP